MYYQHESGGGRSRGRGGWMGVSRVGLQDEVEIEGDRDGEREDGWASRRLRSLAEEVHILAVTQDGGAVFGTMCNLAFFHLAGWRRCIRLGLTA